MKKILKTAIFVSVMGFLTLGIALAVYWKDIRRMPEIAAGFYAKEFCSCLFVTRQSDSYCRELVRQYVPASHLEADHEKKTVEALCLGTKRSAHWTSEKFGCVLDRN